MKCPNHYATHHDAIRCVDGHTIGALLRLYGYQGYRGIAVILHHLVDLRGPLLRPYGGLDLLGDLPLGIWHHLKPLSLLVEAQRGGEGLERTKMKSFGLILVWHRPNRYVAKHRLWNTSMHNCSGTDLVSERAVWIPTNSQKGYRSHVTKNLSFWENILIRIGRDMSYVTYKEESFWKTSGPG